MRAGIVNRVEVWRRRDDERLALGLDITERLPSIVRAYDADPAVEVTGNACAVVNRVKCAEAIDRAVKSIQINL